MAQHILIEAFEHKAIKKIAETIRKQGYFETSMKFESLPDDYKETPEDRVYMAWRSVPNSIVWGGKAGFEVHTKPFSVSADGKVQTSRRTVTKIYLVA